MRVMVMVKASPESEAGQMPSMELIEAMGRYNEELVKAGIMLSGDGLKPSVNGVRVKFSGKERTVVDGPFAETKELIAGYWIWQVQSMDQAVEWVRRCPNPNGQRLRNRNPTVLRGCRFWRSVHARASGARTTVAAADRNQSGYGA